jgi:hypothetical protein
VNSRALRALILVALILSGCFVVGRRRPGGSDSTPPILSPSESGAETASIALRLELGEDGWSQAVAVAPEDHAFEIREIRSTVPHLDLWVEDSEGGLRLLCPASLLDDDLPVLVLPSGSRLKARRIGGREGAADLVLSGRLVRKG